MFPGTEESANVKGGPKDLGATPDKGLSPVLAETGLVSASIDGCGSNDSTCPIDVEKPAGATVRAAFFAASTFGFVIPDGTLTINGTPINFGFTDAVSFLRSFGADVTSIVQPIVDAAPAGTVTLTIGEGASSTSIDGSSLVVIFNDPNVTETSTVVVTFGGQELSGDTFAITLAEPFNDADQDITMSLAIGFGFQLNGANQRSLVDVNGVRLTSSAGGQDDCVNAPVFSQCPNGTLYTVGGLGDDPANPVDPNAGPDDPRTDDELYTLDPLLDAGDTQISVFSTNPSNDDMVHMAVFIIEGSAAILGENILLTPTDDTNPINTNHTLTAFVQDDDGIPFSGRDVDFEIIAGPNVGLMGNGVTNAAGQAMFTYSSAITGTDVIVARFEDSQGNTRTSNEARKTWTDDDPGDDTPPVCGGIDPQFQGPNGEFSGLTTSVFDNESGIASVTFTSLVNLNGFVDSNGPFMQEDVYMTPDPNPASVAITADRIDFTTGGRIVVTVENGAGLTANCDPVVNELSAAVPDVFALEAAYPNPFRAGAGAVQIPFRLAEASDVRVVVYDVLGREVAVLVDDAYAAGSYEVAWPEAASLPAGTYTVRLVAGPAVRTQRITILR